MSSLIDVANAGYNETPIPQEKRSGISKSNYPRSVAGGDSRLLTGSAFLEGGAIIKKNIPLRKKPQALQKAHILRYASNLTAHVRFKYAPLLDSRAPPYACPVAKG